MIPTGLHTITVFGDEPEKFFKLGAKIYAHIVNPATGRPVENMLSTAILSPQASEADALSTAFYVLGVKRSRKYLYAHQNLLAIFYVPRGTGKSFRRVVLRSGSSNLGSEVFVEIVNRQGRLRRAASSKIRRGPL